MPIAPDPTAPATGRHPEDPADRSFARVWAAAAAAPLTEIAPRSAGDGVAALGFALAWARAACGDGLIVWAVAEADLAEDGAPYAEGLAQFGLSLDRLLLVRARGQGDALWTTEQALAIPAAVALCSVAPGGRALDLTATRRLLLRAEENRTRCILLRLDALAGNLGATAARTRWRIAADRGEGEGRELGPPVFAAHLERNRNGPAGLAWRLRWSAHEHIFSEHVFSSADAVDGPVAAAPADRPADAGRRRAV